MKCSICARIFDKSDLGAGVCQDCHDVLSDTQVIDLRQHLNIKEYKPPVITPPLNKDDPILPPVSEQCHGCYADLMGEDLVAWKNGLPCPYCGAESRHVSKSSENERSSTNSASKISEACSLILNSGPSTGLELSLPFVTEIGRKKIRSLVSSPLYQSLLSTISSEHIRIHQIEDCKIGIEDLGSRNGTYINGQKVVGPKPTIFGYGDVLCLHEMCFTLSPPSPFVKIKHIQSNITWKLPISETTQQIHFGRLTNDNKRTPWYIMAQLNLQNDVAGLSRLDAISRRHLFCEVDLLGDQFGMKIWHETGKNPWVVEFISDTLDSRNEASNSQESIKTGSMSNSETLKYPVGTKVILSYADNVFELDIEL